MQQHATTSDASLECDATVHMGGRGACVVQHTRVQAGDL